MYKKSFYNITIEAIHDGSEIVFNTMSGVLGIMDADTLALYNNIEEVVPDLIQDSKTRENLDTMLKTGYVVMKNIDERAALRLIDRQHRAFNANNYLALTIATSLNCNMACTYCYEGRAKVDKKDMCSQVQADLVRFVKKILKNSNTKRFYVVWYGGEPLLNKDAIYNLSSEFKKLCIESEIDYSAQIVTNGILLDAQTAERLKNDCNVVSAQITLDGMAKQHDSKRIFFDGEGSFDLIIDNMAKAREYLQIAVRVNLDKENLDSFIDLKKFFAEKGWSENLFVYPAPIRDYGNCNYNSSCVLSDDEFTKFQTGTIIESYNLDRKNISQVYPARKRNFCGAQCANNFVIDPEGHLYTCWHNVGMLERSFGNIKTGYTLNENYTKWLLSEPPAKCMECQFLPVCQGGCPYEYLEKGEPSCLSWTMDFKNRLKLAYEDHLSISSK